MKGERLDLLTSTSTVRGGGAACTNAGKGRSCKHGPTWCPAPPAPQRFFSHGGSPRAVGKGFASQRLRPKPPAKLPPLQSRTKRTRVRNAGPQAIGSVDHLPAVRLMTPATAVKEELQSFEERNVEQQRAPDSNEQNWLSRLGKATDSLAPFLATLYNLQQTSENTTSLISKITKIPVKDIEFRLRHSSMYQKVLSKREFAQLLSDILGDGDLDLREVEAVFALFDTDGSNSIEPSELVAGLRVLVHSNSTELVMHRIHTLLHLSNRVMVSTQFITRFEMQLLFDGIKRYWMVSEGLEKAEQCAQTLQNLMDRFEWHRAKVPAQDLRNLIFGNEELERLFCVRRKKAAGEDCFQERESVRSSPVPFDEKQQYFLTVRSPKEGLPPSPPSPPGLTLSPRTKKVTNNGRCRRPLQAPLQSGGK